MRSNAAPRPVSTHRRRRRVTGTAVAVGAAGSLALALSMGASLSGYTASITNSGNTAASAALAVAETSGGATCNSYDSTATCGTINKYGGTTNAMKPGQAQTTTVKFANTGSVAVGSATMKAGTCTATSTGVVGATTPSATNTDATNLCSVLNVKVYKASTATGTPVFDGSPAAFQTAAATALDPIAIGANQDYTFVVALPQGATTAVQGQQISQPIVWTFNQ